MEMGKVTATRKMETALTRFQLVDVDCGQFKYLEDALPGVGVVLSPCPLSDVRRHVLEQPLALEVGIVLTAICRFCHFPFSPSVFLPPWKMYFLHMPPHHLLAQHIKVAGSVNLTEKIDVF